MKKKSRQKESRCRILKNYVDLKFTKLKPIHRTLKQHTQNIPCAFP